MIFSIDKLLNYSQANYPQLTTAQPQWFNNEFGKIRKTINSILSVMKAGSIGVTIKSGLPATSDLPAGTTALFKDTSGGGVYLAYNDAGTIKKVTLT